MPLSKEDESLFMKYFEMDISEIDLEEFKKKKKLIQAKFHPDKFEKFDDEEVREMAKEKYLRISALCDRAAQQLMGGRGMAIDQDAEAGLKTGEQYASEGLLIEVLTRDKELKYRMFGSGLKWMLHGEAFTIPGTGAKIRLWDTSGFRAMGFKENIKLTLSFATEDSIDIIIDWLFGHVSDSADILILNKEKVALDHKAVSQVMRKVTVKLID